jgi:hypothetical protein
MEMAMPHVVAASVEGLTKFDCSPSGGVPEGNWQRSKPPNDMITNDLERM